jgi:hypothetical protein
MEVGRVRDDASTMQDARGKSGDEIVRDCEAVVADLILLGCSDEKRWRTFRRLFPWSRVGAPKESSLPILLNLPESPSSYSSWRENDPPSSNSATSVIGGRWNLSSTFKYDSLLRE